MSKQRFRVALTLVLIGALVGCAGNDRSAPPAISFELYVFADEDGWIDRVLPRARQ